MLPFIFTLQFILLGFLQFPYSWAAPVNIINSWALPGNNTYPEGIARQSDSPYFYTGSVSTGAIWRGSINSPDLEVFIDSPNNFNLTSAAGMKIAGNKLFVAGADTEIVFVFNLDTAALVHRFTTKAPGRSMMNDLVVAGNGNIYITDSWQPNVFVITAAQIADTTVDQEMEVFAELLPPFEHVIAQFNSNGIVITVDQEYLLIGAYYRKSIFALNLSTKAINKVDLGGQEIGSPDGMLIRDNLLYSVHTHPDYISVVEIRAPYLTGRVLPPITNTRLVQPATAAFDGPNHMLVTNFQIGAAEDELVLPFTVVKVPISPEEIVV